MDSKKYKQALNLFNEQSAIATNSTIVMAIKASLNDPYIQTSLIHFYMQNHKIDDAYRLFSKITNKSNPMYAAMFKGFITNRMPEKALDLFDTMTIEPDHVTLVVLLNVCAQLASDRAKTIGKKLLQQISNNYQNNNIVLNTAIHMLMKFGDIKSAENIFYSIKNKDNFTFGAMMKGYVENEQYEKVFDLYEEMNIKPDDIIYIIVLNACAGLSNYRAMNIGKQILQKNL
ncbi:unnamed protein product [Rotaria sp. Silwood1]|nr:unnamed protein product [Rotaria sp. Silwood1]